MELNGLNYFGILDYTIVGLMLGVSLAIGLYYALKSGKKRTGEELLMGGRQMAALPIACSMLVSLFSGVGLIGMPADIYLNGILLVWTPLLIILFSIPLAAYLFMSVIYELKLTSVYEYLELRFDSVAVRCLVSIMFVIQLSIFTGVGLYAPAIALELFLGLPVWFSVFSTGISATVYTSIGGLKAVIWTDVFQFILIIVGLVSLVTRGFITGGGLYEAFDRAHEHGRLEFFDFNVDPFQKYNTLNIVLGYTIQITCYYGIYQPNVQRYSSVPNFREAIKTMAWNAVLRELLSMLLICTGVSIFATYAGCDPLLLGEIKKADQIVPYYFVQELSWIPGMMGIFTACIMSAVLSTVSSNLNSLAAVTWEDFLSKFPYFAKKSNINKGYIIGVLCVVYGALAIVLAFASVNLGSIIQFTMSIMSSFNALIGGCFVMGLLIPCSNKVGVICGVLSGLGTTVLLSYKAFELKVPYATLPTSVASCPAGTNFSMVAYPLSKFATEQVEENEWPDKIFRVSFILYPFIVFCVTILIGLLASLLSRPFLTKPKTSCQNYLHPLVKRICCIRDSPLKSTDRGNIAGHQIEIELAEKFVGI